MLLFSRSVALSALQWFSLVSLALAVARTSPPSGAKVVRQTGTLNGEYSTISAAVASLSGAGPHTIFIYGGNYTEQVSINLTNVTIFGYTTDTSSYKNNVVTISGRKNAQDDGGNDACATLRAEQNFFNLYNVNVENTYGIGKQATAVAARGSYQGYYGVKLSGNQDTLFADTTLGYQYYSNSWIQGSVDYIYGKASAWFGECILASTAGGAITANSRTLETDPGYYVIDNCEIRSVSSSSLTGKIYLGRPWRALARVVFQNSELPSLINAIGYSTLAAGATPIFSEFGNTGAGADTSKRVTYTPITAAITKNQVLGSDWRSWTDTTY